MLCMDVVPVCKDHVLRGGVGLWAKEPNLPPPPTPPSSFLYPCSMTRSALHYLNAYNRLNNTNTVDAVLQGKSKSG